MISRTSDGRKSAKSRSLTPQSSEDSDLSLEMVSRSTEMFLTVKSPCERLRLRSE